MARRSTLALFAFALAMACGSPPPPPYPRPSGRSGAAPAGPLDAAEAAPADAAPVHVTARPLDDLDRRTPRCDPVPGETVSVEPPASEPKKQCGDGKLGSFAVCSQTVGGGGCDTPGPTSRGLAVEVRDRSSIQCLQATEPCDGANLGRATCASQGFAGGTLACATSCDAFEISACEPCFARNGVRCATLAGVTSVPAQIEQVAFGNDGAAVVWTELETGGTTRRLALIGATPRTTAMITAPIERWREPADAARLADVAWLGKSWSVWSIRGQHLWEQRFSPTGAPLGTPRDVQGDVAALFVGQIVGGSRVALVIPWTTTPKAYALGADGLGAVVALTRQTRIERGADRAFVIPIPDAKAGETDLGLFVTRHGLTSLRLYKDGRAFGGGGSINAPNAGSPTVDLGLAAGSFKVDRTATELVTSWKPTKAGPPWSARHPLETAGVPSSVFANHPAVTALRYVDGGNAHLALAWFAPPSGPPRLLTALIRR